MKCKAIIAGLDHIPEREVFYTPDGYEAVVVSNDSRRVIFRVEQGDHAGVYIYDKQTGVGAIQSFA